MNARYICVPLTSDERHLDKIMDFVIDRKAETANIPDEEIVLER